MEEVKVTHVVSHIALFSAENKIDGSEAYGHQHELHDRESSLVTASGNSHNIAQRLDDQNLPSYLPPVLEVPISSISEGFLFRRKDFLYTYT